jgi:hypothetical protein
LKDITFANDGNPSFREDGRVNYDKFHILATILGPIAGMQKMTLSYPTNLVLRSYLLYDTLVLDIDTQYEKSKDCQPLKNHSSLSGEKVLTSSNKLSRRLSRIHRTKTSLDLSDFKNEPKHEWGSPVGGKLSKTLNRIKSATDLSSFGKYDLPIIPLPARRRSDENIVRNEQFNEFNIFVEFRSFFI